MKLWKKILLGVVGGFVALGAIGSLMDDSPTVEAGASTTTTAETTTSTEETTTTTSTTTTTTPSTTTTFAALEVHDFLIELFVVEDQCFGSAGALVTVEPELEYVGYVRGKGPFPGGEYLLVYEISGAENGSETYNLTVHDDGNYTYDQHLISTATCDHDLQVEGVGLRDR